MNLRENKNCITFNYVMEFVNKIEPGALMFSMNYGEGIKLLKN